MKYYKIVENGYIVLVGVDCGGSEITEQEYNAIMQTVRHKPTAESGYDYKLKENLEWEICEMPTIDDEETATEEDYQSALESLGVDFNA